MKIKEIIENWFSDKTMLFEMPNIQPKDSGLKQVVFVGKVGGQHSARVKVSNIPGTFSKRDNFSIPLAKKWKDFEPVGVVKIPNSDLDKIKEWISINHEDLIAIANQMEDVNFDGTFTIYDENGENPVIKTMDDMIKSLKKV